MSISLIANSGVQFHKFKIAINTNDQILSTMGFYEREDRINASVLFEYAYYLPDQDYWIPKQILKYHDYLDENDRIKDNINEHIIKPFRLTEDRDYFTVSSIQICLDLFCSKADDATWLPIPYFKQNTDGNDTFGPVSWARMMLKEIKPEQPVVTNSYRKTTKEYNVVLIFDTELAKKQNVYYSPVASDSSENENTFNFCNKEDLLLNFCNSQYGCDWVDRYIKRIVLGSADRKEFPMLNYLGYYLFFLKYLSTLTGKDENGEDKKAFPEVTLHTDQRTPVEVDLVLDIGNSNTCGILFESPGPNRPFHFNSVKKLKLNDLSCPEKAYSEPFSMRLVFVDTKFGDMDSAEHKAFKWPSLLRVGEEGGRLINKYYSNEDKGVETATHQSSPKRYLWDTKKTEIAWEFINNAGSNMVSAIYYEGISEQFKADGEYAADGAFSFSPYYSRKSLMTFVFIETLLHAISQVNSHEFRSTHGNRDTPRKIKRITITCPTSVIQHEQVALRECANIAVRSLTRFFSDTFLGSFEDESSTKADLEIVPSPKDLSRKLDQVLFRKDWIYDEATCSQLVFLYGEISKRFLNNAETFFKLYGKLRTDVTYEDRKALTVASIDIGGGTTDLMICAYQYEEGQNLAVIKPHPLYWESFNFAGDDLLKEIVQQVVLEGAIPDDYHNGCMGVIANAAKASGVTGVAEKMLHFFGSDSNKQGYIARVRRKNFVVQIAIPIALHYLQHAIDDKPDGIVGYNDFFPERKPSIELVKYFNQHFAPLKLEDIKWKLSAKRVFEIVETTLDPLIKQLSGLVAAYGCDFLLLAGKPTTLPKIREMFIKYYPLSPERIISLSKDKYRVGRWYPFANDQGYIEDPKTMVSVGALIALMGGKLDRLDGFRINTQLLKQRLVSTADNLGVLNQYTQLIETILISPDQNTAEIDIHSLPIKLGYKQLPNKHYRAKPIYKIEFNDEEIKRRMIEQSPFLAANEIDLHKAVQNYKVTIKDIMPLKVMIQRNWAESKENVTIGRIIDANQNERSRQLLSLSIMTLADEYSYWLDTGGFVLNLKN